MQTPHVHPFFDEDTSTLTYVVADPETKDAIVIDPVLNFDSLASQTSTESVEKVVSFIQEQGLTLRAVLETHAHADHISSAQFLKAKFSVPVAVGSHIVKVQTTFANVFNLSSDVRTDGSQFDILLEASRNYEFGSLSVAILATPGHTPGCVSYHIGDAVFTGDALFIEDYGTGRTDFPGGSASKLHDSVVNTLYELPGETRVFVGHDYMPGGRAMRCESTIACERESNIQLKKVTSAEDFVAFRNKRDSSLPPPRLIYPSIQINVYGGKLPAIESNGSRYLRIPLNNRTRTDDVGNPSNQETN